MRVLVSQAYGLSTALVILFVIVTTLLSHAATTMSKVSYFTNANHVVAKNLTFNTYISDGEGQ